MCVRACARVWFKHQPDHILVYTDVSEKFRNLNSSNAEFPAGNNVNGLATIQPALPQVILRESQADLGKLLTALKLIYSFSGKFTIK